jgi:hypothetical protein
MEAIRKASAISQRRFGRPEYRLRKETVKVIRRAEGSLKPTIFAMLRLTEG